jgi:dTDP-4-amino-4,6-dideoxygalactose transaminase
MSPDAPERVRRVLESGFIGQGPVVEEFERALGEFTPQPPVSVNSCTSAIHAVLMHLGVGPGDEVITTPLTCVASNAPVLAVGARPVWADVSATTGNIDTMDVTRKVTPRTRAIIAVNWTGRAANYVRLRNLGLPIIEDAAHGPLVGDRPAGNFICYSFGPIKHLTTGDGGAVVTADAEARASLRLLRWYGLDRTSSQDFRCAQDIQRAGMKFHMTDLNAAIGLANLPHLAESVARHRSNAHSLYVALCGVPNLFMPPLSDESNYWVFPILLRNSAERDAMKAHLGAQGVAASQVHSRNDDHAAYNFPNGPLPGLDEYDARHLNIPCGWWLSQDDIVQVIRAVRSFWS